MTHLKMFSGRRSSCDLTSDFWRIASLPPVFGLASRLAKRLLFDIFPKTK